MISGGIDVNYFPQSRLISEATFGDDPLLCCNFILRTQRISPQLVIADPKTSSLEPCTLALYHQQTTCKF